MRFAKRKATERLKEKGKDDTGKKFELDVAVGRSGYFLRQSSSGFVVGPKNSRDGVPRHVTIPVDEEGEAKNIHMKSKYPEGQREDWRIVPKRVIQDFNAWVQANSTELERSTIRTLDESSLCLSVRRILISFSIAQPFLTRAVWILARGLSVFRFVEEETELSKGSRPMPLRNVTGDPLESSNIG